MRAEKLQIHYKNKKSSGHIWTYLHFSAVINMLSRLKEKNNKPFEVLGDYDGKQQLSSSATLLCILV